MPTSLPSPTLTIHPTFLTQSTFSPFGTVIECPLPQSTTNFPSPPPSHPSIVSANQNTALKHLDVTQMRDPYGAAPSHIPSKAVMNMFSCFPRTLRSTVTHPKRDYFDVRILERHPYTTQTFIPLSPPSAPLAEKGETKYLVIVAPSLPATSHPPLFQKAGPPDLGNIQAFWAHRGQAVTYGAGTWHAPMAVIGDERIDFVVVQFANGVAEEDCQEVELALSTGEQGVSVLVGPGSRAGEPKM
ncbi:MAG: hypothetical protein LQ346_008559 [Caloplaca aetnensis]|nr:MAG: hypothetical protein LQ346_008559 [Caloplaca aetnensis]